LNGGSDNTKFYSSLSYGKQDGIISDNGMERFTGNFNVTHTFGRFTLRAQSMFSKMKQHLANEGTSFDGAVANYAFFQSPSSTPYDVAADGTKTLNDGCGMYNVNPLYECQHSENVSDTRKMFSSFQLTYNIWDNLNFSEKITYDQNRIQEDDLWDKYSNNGGPAGVMQRVMSNRDNVNTQSQLSYIKSFGAHNVDALLGFETEDSKYAFNYLSGQDYPGEKYEFANAGTTSAESKKYESKLVSLLCRLNYNYNNRYYAGLSYRRDGSSRLAHDNRWGTFWSVSGSWRFSEENFFAPLKSVASDGKLRLSYGVNGTQPYDYYAYMNLYKYGQYYDGQSGMGIVGIGNSDLKWEKNHAFNLGLDLTFWNRLSFTFDWYTRKTKDLIYDMPISAVPGYYDKNYNTKVAQNIGSLKNTGFELTITSQNFQTKDFTWTTSLNMGHNSNKVVKLNGENQIVDGVMVHKVGQPYYSYYMYEYAGVDPETGKELYFVNGNDANTARNTTTDVNKANKVIVGKHQASLEGGITNNITYKFIDFGCTITYSIGGDAVDYATWQESNGGSNLYNGAVPSYYNAAATWKKPGDIAALPKFQYGSSSIMSSRWLMPTDYLRVKNLTLGFSAPKNYIQHLGLSKARAYFSASNLLTWKSDDLRVDPEMRVDGLCRYQTPSMRTFTFGIELGF
jgi:TonB-linked SusC/RagA family outer membrane protein